MNTIVFEHINHTHYKSITEIYNYYIRHSTATYHVEPLSEQDVIEYFEFSAKNTETFIVKNNEEIAGFCLLRPYNKKEGYKYTFEITIYLKPDYEKKGIGSKAVIFLEEVAKEKKVHVLIAGICAENQASISLFEKFGYKKCGLFKEVGYKFDRYLDTIYYQKRLEFKYGKDFVIKEISTDRDIVHCTRVIQRSFKTVADEFGLTEHNAPTNPAFITFKKLKQSINEGTQLFGLIKEKQLIGCIAVERSQKDERIFFIERLAVLPEARHQGYGTKLLDFACAYIKSRHGKTVSIGIIAENNILKKWYITYGFKVIAVKKLNHLPFTVCFLEKAIK